MYVKGLELNTTSTSSKTVSNSSMSRLAFPITFFKQDFTDPTKRSKYPPHQGLRSKLNFHLILFSCKNENTEGSFDRLSKNLAANLNVLALSELMSDGVPLRAVNLLRLLRNTGADKSFTKSKCNALDVQ